MIDLGYINLALNGMTGAGLVAYFGYRAKVKGLDNTKEATNRDDNRTDFEVIIEELKGQRDAAFARLDERDARLTKLEAEIKGLHLTRDLDPFPHWVVDRSGEYLYVNREFERYFLEPKGLSYRDAVGKKHPDLWPPEFCEVLRTLDAAARSRPDGTARAVTEIDVAELGRTNVTVHKFPIRFKPSGVIVAYAGYITDLDPIERMVG